jgi:uncharacterized protein (TIGR02996 family)
MCSTGWASRCREPSGTGWRHRVRDPVRLGSPDLREVGVMTEEGFLEAIRETPDDDAPRLVYADWLDDHGQADRAEFIRVQCELAHLPRTSDRYWELEDRSDALLQVQKQAWSGPLPGLANQWTFRRGFVESVQIEGEKFLPHANDLFAALPLRSLQLIIVGWQNWGYLARFAALAHLARLHKLDLSDCCFPVAQLHKLIASPYLTGLRTLDLQGNDFSSGILPALSASPVLAGLTSLSLGGDSFRSRTFGTGSVRWVAKGPWPARLTRLYLGWVSGGVASVRALVASPHLAQLRSLSLHAWDLTDAGVRELAACPRLAGLTSLRLDGDRIGDVGARALLDSHALRGLKSLYLASDRISEPIKEALEARFGPAPAGPADEEESP